MDGTGRQMDPGQPLGLGPQPGGGRGVAGPARRADEGGGTDQPERAAWAVVATGHGRRAGRRVQQRLGAWPDVLRREEAHAVEDRPLRLFAGPAGPRGAGGGWGGTRG